MCALSVVCNYNCVGNNGATATVMDTIKLVIKMHYNFYHIIFCSFTCTGEDTQELSCTQRITLQYSDAICLELCLSCKIALNQSCNTRVCCADIPFRLFCNFEPAFSGCGIYNTNVCGASFRVNAFENNITNLSIFYNGSTYDTGKEKNSIGSFMLFYRCDKFS